MNAISTEKKPKNVEDQDTNAEDTEEEVLKMMKELDKDTDCDSSEYELKELKAVILKIRGFIVKVIFNMTISIVWLMKKTGSEITTSERIFFRLLQRERP